MQLRSSRGFNILELLEPDPSEEQSRRSRKTLERALFPESREVPLLTFSCSPCYLQVGDFPAMLVSVSQALRRKDDLWVPCIEAFSFVLEGIGEDLNLRM